MTHEILGDVPIRERHTRGAVHQRIRRSISVSMKHLKELAAGVVVGRDAGNDVYVASDVYQNSVARIR